MRHYVRNISIALVMTALKVLFLAHYSEFRPSFYLANDLGLGEHYFNTGYMVTLLMELFPVFIIQFIEGIGIYTHFCTGSDYYFSRQKNRKWWFFKESLRMGLRILCYFVVYLTISFITPCFWFQTGIQLVELKLLSYIILYFALYAFMTAIWINICSILLGSQTGLIIVYVMQLIFVALLLLFENRIPLEGIGVWLLKINPISNIILRWHSSNNIVSEFLNMYQIDFDLNFSVFYFIILIIISILIGVYVVNRQDISLQNREVIG